jgi:dihydrolipoamide dehydrogenase
MSFSTQVAVIGGGPGGYAAAFLAADLGLQVTLVDPEKNPGGVCLYRGCIPTKALLQVVKVKREARRAGEWGLRFEEPEVDVDRIREWKNEVVEKLTGGLGQLARARKVKHIHGLARFEEPGRLSVRAASGGSEPEENEIEYEHCILATGARPVPLPGTSFDSPRIMDSRKALLLEDIPETLLVVGAGYIGLELGTLYAELGSRVSIVEMMPSVMPGTDRDLVDTFLKQTEDLFEEIILKSKAGLEAKEKSVKVEFEKESGEKNTKEYAKVLVTVGRSPNIGDLGLENIGIGVNEKDYIEVDEERRTGSESVFAIGDITGPPLLAHKATHEGRVAAEVIAGRNAAYDPRAIPSVEYTDPEIAWCGLTETEAAEQDRTVKTARFPWGASGRAITMGLNGGLTKLLIDPESKRILGAGIVGAYAGELIPELLVAIEMGARASDLGMVMHPHPTLSETIMEAAQSLYGEATNIRRRAR